MNINKYIEVKSIKSINEILSSYILDMDGDIIELGISNMSASNNSDIVWVKLLYYFGKLHSIKDNGDSYDPRIKNSENKIHVAAIPEIADALKTLKASDGDIIGIDVYNTVRYSIEKYDNRTYCEYDAKTGVLDFENVNLVTILDRDITNKDFGVNINIFTHLGDRNMEQLSYDFTKCFGNDALYGYISEESGELIQSIHKLYRKINNETNNDLQQVIDELREEIADVSLMYDLLIYNREFVKYMEDYSELIPIDLLDMGSPIRPNVDFKVFTEIIPMFADIIIKLPYAVDEIFSRKILNNFIVKLRKKNYNMGTMYEYSPTLSIMNTLYNDLYKCKFRMFDIEKYIEVNYGKQNETMDDIYHRKMDRMIKRLRVFKRHGKIGPSSSSLYTKVTDIITIMKSVFNMSATCSIPNLNFLDRIFELAERLKIDIPNDLRVRADTIVGLKFRDISPLGSIVRLTDMDELTKAGPNGNVVMVEKHVDFIKQLMEAIVQTDFLK